MWVLFELAPVIINTVYATTGIIAWIVMLNDLHDDSGADQTVNYIESNDPGSDYNSDYNSDYFDNELDDMEHYIESYLDNIFF